MTIWRAFRLVGVTLAVSSLVGTVACGPKSISTPRKKIALLYTEPHPVLNTIITAFETRAKELIPGVEFVERHASGNKAEYPAVVRSVLEDPDVVLLAPITTPMSIEAAKQARGRLPIVFLGVTDPQGARLVTSLEHPTLMSGVSDNPPMEGVIDLVRLYNPNARVVGIPYDPRDQPGVTTAKRAARACREKGVQAVLSPVSSEAELRTAVRALAVKSDVLVIGMDNMMMKNAGLIASTAQALGKPLFAADDKSVEMGAVAGVGVNYADVGRLGAEVAAEVLVDRKAIGSIPVRVLSTGDIYYNTSSSQLLGLSVPVAVSSHGRKVGAEDR